MVDVIEIEGEWVVRVNGFRRSFHATRAEANAAATRTVAEERMWAPHTSLRLAR